MNLEWYRLLAAIALAALSLVAPRPASAQAIIDRFAFQDSYTDNGGNECLSPDLVGAVTATLTGSGQGVFSGPAESEHWTVDTTYRVDFPDGSYALGSAVEHHVRTFNERTRATATVTIQEPRTLYAADGRPIGQVLIHYILHVTFSDANHSGQPDAGEITASIEQFRFTCR
jgi:hypothetical protein